MNILQSDILKPFKEIYYDLIDSLPTVLGFIAFVLIAWIFIKVFLWH